MKNSKKKKLERRKSSDYAPAVMLFAAALVNKKPFLTSDDPDTLKLMNEEREAVVRGAIAYADALFDLLDNEIE